MTAQPNGNLLAADDARVGGVFRAIWPIVDETVKYGDLLRQAATELPTLTTQAHVRVIGAGRFSIAESVYVPGSGRLTDSVLVYEAPAESMGLPKWRQVAS